MKTITSSGTLLRRWAKIRAFASIIRTPARVRHAFDRQDQFKFWWKLVLTLHGKPAQMELSRRDQCACVAEGFLFYGWLYRVLAMLIAGATVCCAFAKIAGFYWIVALGVGAIGLWMISSLAFIGADEYHKSLGSHIWYLVTFLFFISLFLATTLSVTSLQVRCMGLLPDALNIGITIGSFTFGIGSYGIELASLAADDALNLARERADT